MEKPLQQCHDTKEGQSMWKWLICLFLTILAYCLFDLGCSIQNHVIGILVKGIGGGLFMFVGMIIKED